MGKSKDLATGAAYQDQTESDTRYVNTAGDTMSGKLTVQNDQDITGTITHNPSGSGNKYLSLNTASSGDGHILFQRAGSNKYQISADTSNNLFTWNYTKNGTSFRINADGSIIMPHQPCFRAKGSSSWTTLTQANGVQVMNLGTEEFDVGGHYSTSTYRFTAPVAGKYLLRLHAYVRLETQDDDGNHAYAQIHKNNAGSGGNASIFGYHNSGDSDQMANVTTIMDMAANDFATAVLSPASGSSSYYGAACYFMGYLIG